MMLTLSRRVPAHKKVVSFDWVKRNFSQYNEQYRKARAGLKPLDKCFWCARPFDEGDEIVLAKPKGPKKTWSWVPVALTRCRSLKGWRMIKAIADVVKGPGKGKRKVLILGLDSENWRRLLAGLPIHFNGETIGLEKLDVLIVGGESQADVLKQLTPGIGSNTVIHTDEPGSRKH